MTIVDELTYRSYMYQRATHGMTARQAANIFANAEAMEARYQKDPEAQHLRKERVLQETRERLEGVPKDPDSPHDTHIDEMEARMGAADMMEDR